MVALPARRNSLCLFCSWTARPALARPPPPQRRLPRIQAAQRSTINSKKRFQSALRSPLQLGARFKKNFKPLESSEDDVNVSRIVNRHLANFKTQLEQAEVRDSLGLSDEDFEAQWGTFEDRVSQWTEQAPAELVELARQAKRNKETLSKQLQYLFYNQVYSGKLTTAELGNQKEVADLRHPAEWYPATREIQRTVHLHVGPTNSGKTYHALKRLEEVPTGIYLGPLRLLAHEVYTRLNAKGKNCALVTGEEQRLPPGRPSMFSCTVEMAPLNTRFDVAVIDEIQMISHPERGWAWTQAFLGLQAREIHLCGEARTVPIMRQLATLAGDTVVVHEYDRLTPLKVEPKSLDGDMNRLEKGDCIVAFNVRGIHALRRLIESRTKKRCAIVYGSLPPETRAQQARLFNDPDNDYDFLVASDAIGMGLNLAIKRVIFETTVKSNGIKFLPLQLSEIKQIAGRAGRYKTAHQAVAADSVDPVIGLDDVKEQPPKEKTIGWVTTLDPIDLPLVKSSMQRELEDITSAGLFPPSLIIERFANYFPPRTPFSYVMLRLHEISEVHSRFHLCELKDQLAIADSIQSIKNLSIQERITLCSTPANMREDLQRQFIRSLAQCISENRPAALLDLDHLPFKEMDTPADGTRDYLYRLEQLHKMLISYLWLSYRFPNILISRNLANYAKKLVEDQIEDTLTKFSSIIKRNQRKKQERKEAKKTMQQVMNKILALQDEQIKASHKNDSAHEIATQLAQESVDADAQQQRSDILTY